MLELDGALGVGSDTLRLLQRLRHLSINLPLAAACASELALMSCLRRLDLSMLCHDGGAQLMGPVLGWQDPGYWNWACAVPALFAALAGLPLLQTLGLSRWLPREWDDALSVGEGIIEGVEQPCMEPSELASAVPAKAGPFARRRLAYIQPVREGLELLHQQGKPLDLVVYEPPSSACWGI